MAHMSRRNLKCEIMGSGDNKFLNCKVPPEMSPGELQTTIVNGLTSFSRISDLPIKLEETFISAHYMEYARVSYLRGKRVSQALKRASRVGTGSQETIPSINTTMSGIYATGTSVAAECASPGAVYALKSIEAGMTLETRGFTGPVQRLAAVLLLGMQF